MVKMPFIADVFNSQYSAERKTFAAVGRMNDLDVVDRRTVFYRMRSGAGSSCLVDDHQVGGLPGWVRSPSCVYGQFLQNLFGQGDGGTAGASFLRMVYLHHAHL